MVIEFSLSNYRSFNKIQTISFRATGLVSENKEVDKNNIIEIDGSKILKVLGIYGANASGKSNLIKGLNFLRLMVSSSLDSEGLAKSQLDAFKLTSEKNEHSGFFQIVLLLEGKKYRYGFTLNENGIVSTEWLFGPAEKNETFYFKRTGQIVSINPDRFAEGEKLPLEKLRTETLFLSFCSSYDGQISKTIRSFIANNITVEIEDRRSRFVQGRVNLNQGYALTNRLLEAGKKDLVLKWMKEVGLAVNDIKLEKINIDDISPNYFQTVIYFLKNIYDNEGKVTGNIQMNLRRDESAGTQKFYSYIGALDFKFNRGGLYISDEIDSNFHPSLLQRLIKLFNSTINKSNAQILFTSHDTNLMDPEILRRDQFYFAEKSSVEETILYSLSDLKGIRNNADFARQYLAGIYGALPLLGNFIDKSEELPFDSN
jgi:AAA15 family ATPase/GTPase